MGRTRNKITRATKNKSFKKSHDTKRRPKDIDQIQDEIKYINETGKPLSIEPNEDLPGLGQHYCVTCARHFLDEKTLNIHITTKAHKRRLKDVADKQYTQTEADVAAGKSIEILPPAHSKMSVE
eukprot:gene20947-27150_t